MADWNAHEARIRDRALAEAIALLDAHPTGTRLAASLLQQLRDGKLPTAGAEFPEPCKGRPALYPFASMAVGDTFDAPRNLGKRPGGKCRRQDSVIASAKAWARRNNPEAKFATRLIDDNTVRCKRIA